jgi:molecular chaperone DnaK (HSP70)
MYNISKINQEEQKYCIKNNYDKEKGTFKFELNKIPYEITGDDCVCSYLKKLDEKIKTKLKTDEKQTYIFSVPDYYTYYQKVALKIILQSLKLDNEYPFINESTALTMYYGYLNYKEFTNENKYVIFVDIGHSKTSFILSEFTKNEFIVKEVENIPFLGGRDFNDRIFEKCLNQYQIENNQNLEVNGRKKVRLYEEIEKARKTLTINDSSTINVDALDGENDFSYEITKEEFEKLIKSEIEKFKNGFELFYNKVKKYPIWRIEMGGQLMRTPILEEIIYKISNIKLSKTIALDECHSLGTLLYTLFIIQGKKFEHLNNVLSYNNNYLIYHINHANIVISIFPSNKDSKDGYRFLLGKSKELSNMLNIHLVLFVYYAFLYPYILHLAIYTIH